MYLRTSREKLLSHFTGHEFWEIMQFIVSLLVIYEPQSSGGGKNNTDAVVNSAHDWIVILQLTLFIFVQKMKLYHFLSAGFFFLISAFPFIMCCMLMSWKEEKKKIYFWLNPEVLHLGCRYLGRYSVLFLPLPSTFYSPAIRIFFLNFFSNIF